MSVALRFVAPPAAAAAGAGGAPPKPQSPTSATTVGRFSLPPSVGDGLATRLPADRFVDRFGFLVTPEDDGARPLSPDEVQLEGARARKWEEMLRDWGAFVRRHPRAAKRRARKGVPNALRGRAWPVLAGADTLKAAHPGLYLDCLAQTPARSDMMCIALDLPRTYPNHVLFTTAHIDAAPTTPGSALLPDGALAVGQRALRNVLRAFACHDPRVGYCQGMAFVAGLLITYMSEEDAFFMLVALTRGPKYGLAGACVRARARSVRRAACGVAEPAALRARCGAHPTRLARSPSPPPHLLLPASRRYVLARPAPLRGGHVRLLGARVALHAAPVRAL